MKSPLLQSKSSPSPAPVTAARASLLPHRSNDGVEFGTASQVPQDSFRLQDQSLGAAMPAARRHRFSHNYSRVRVRPDAAADRTGNESINGYERHGIVPLACPLTEPAMEMLRQPDAGTGADAGTPTAPVFPTYTQITGNSTVSTAMDAAWTATKAATTRTGRREQGFWIKYDTSSSGYTCEPTFTGPTVGPDETGAADPGTKPADSGTTYTVGLFHTHTPMTYRTGGTRDVGPSGADNRFHTSNNVVGIVYDYVESPAGSGSIPAGHPLNSAAQLYSSGPTQRT